MILDGLESSVHLSCVMPAAATTDNARMVPVSACLVGTADTAHWKDVHEDVLAMDSVELPMMDTGNASASTAGTVQTARR